MYASVEQLCRHAGSIEEALAELDMEHYDDDEGAGGGGRPFGAGPPGMSFYRCALREVSTHCFLTAIQAGVHASLAKVPFILMCCHDSFSAHVSTCASDGHGGRPMCKNFCCACTFWAGHNKCLVRFLR